jgi:hypothetical protein
LQEEHQLPQPSLKCLFNVSHVSVNIFSFVLESHFFAKGSCLHLDIFKTKLHNIFLYNKMCPGSPYVLLINHKCDFKNNHIYYTNTITCFFFSLN